MQGLIRRMADDNYLRKEKYTVNYSLDSMINDEFAPVRTKIQHVAGEMLSFWSMVNNRNEVIYESYHGWFSQTLID
jgi:hypothetical protein